MLFFLVEVNILFKPEHRPVHPGLQVSLLSKLYEKVFVLALFPLDQWREHLKKFTVIVSEYLVNYLIHAVATDFFAAAGTVRGPGPTEKEPQVVVNFRHCTDR